MDDENKSSNSSGAPQGIFSTPELTVDANNLTQPTPSNDQSRIASIFANTETGKQAQRLNDAMGVNAAPATEDIVIDNGGKKKSKMPLAVVLMILILACVGVGVWALVTNMDSNQGDQDSVPAKTLDVAYSNFMNYLIFGKEGNDSFSMDSLPENYSLQNPYGLFAESVIAGLNNTDKQEYLSRLSEKYNDLSKAYTEVNNGTELGGEINDYFNIYARWCRQ